MDRLKKTSTIKDSAVLSKSKFFTKKDMIPTPIPAINIALSGSLDGGLTPGLTMWAGPSKHFKTAFSLLMAKSYMDKYPDSVLLFYDSEFGTPQSYFESFGIDMDRVLHTPITDIELLKFDCMKQIEGILRDERVIIIIDSIGNLASKKEVEDALDGKSTTDMTRAKQLKSFFRMVTPHLTIKDIPMIAVNHTYKTLEMYAKDVVGGGTGSYYSADNIFIIGRQQEKDKNELVGYNFIINVEKSRYVREKSKIPVTVLHQGGISKWSGLLDMAEESGHIVKTKIGNSTAYAKVDMATGVIDEENKVKTDNTNTSAFWLPILKDKSFRAFVENKYSVGHGSIIQEEDVASSVINAIDDQEDDYEVVVDEDNAVTSE
jgi:RecA/RadA recombinase